MIYCWCSSPEELSKTYKDNPNLCWKCEQKEETFYHGGWMCINTKNVMDPITLIQTLKFNLPRKPEISTFVVIS